MSTPQPVAATAGRLNTGFYVDLYFLVPMGEETRKTVFRLRRHPEMAAWTLNLLDFVLSQQGQGPPGARLAEPPGGAALDKLVRGGVVQASRRPDGGLALRLTPDFDVCLFLVARRHHAPAHAVTLRLMDDPALSRWLLTHVPEGAPPADPARADAALAASLRRHAILVDELPPPAVHYPDPALPADLAADLATAAQVFPQPAGAPMPAEVRDVLGRHVPELPPGAGLLWGLDAGSGLAFPSLWDGAADFTPLAGAAAAPRAARWDRQREEARESLRSRRYAVLREIVPPAQQAKLRHYVRQLVERGYFPALGDGQVERRTALYNEPTIGSIHNGLARILSSVAGEALLPSYCYLSCYEEGSVLERHRDRAQCAWNLSVVFDMSGPAGEPDPWPIYLELDGKPEEVLLAVGDGVAYSGTELWHWRDALPAGQRAIVCFFHFVPQDFTGSLD